MHYNSVSMLRHSNSPSDSHTMPISDSKTALGVLQQAWRHRPVELGSSVSYMHMPSCVEASGRFCKAAIP